MTDEEVDENGYTAKDRRDIAEINAELGSIEFPIRVPLFVPDTFGNPKMEVGIGVFENEDRLTIDFLANAPGKAVRRMMRRDIVLGLQFVMLNLETEEETPNKENTDEPQDQA